MHLNIFLLQSSVSLCILHFEDCGDGGGGLSRIELPEVSWSFK